MSFKIKEVAFVNKNLEKDYKELEKGTFEDKELFKFITRAKDDLLSDPLCGIRVPKSIVPKEYIKKYEINNLWKYDLPNAWRMLYTISGNDIRIVSVILEWLTHKEYERRFGY